MPAKTSPRQLRTGAWVVSALALAVLVNIARSELDYANLAAAALPVQARITRIDVRRSGQRVDHVMHYECMVRGRTHQFYEADDRDRLEELHTATSNGFVGPNAPFRIGKTLPLLVDPEHPERHRPDRARLSGAWLLSLRDGLAVLFLGGLAVGMFYVSGSTSLGPRSAPRRQSISLHTSDHVLQLQIELDVPWPDDAASEELAALRARMPTRKLGRKSTAVDRHVTSANISLLLRPSRDGQLDAASAMSLRGGAQLERVVLGDTRPLHKGTHARLHATLSIADAATALRVEVRLLSGAHFTHTVPLRPAD